MPKPCVRKKIESGMSRKEAIRVCYPKARKAVKVAGEVVKTVAGGPLGVGVKIGKEISKRVRARSKKTRDEVMGHKPPKMKTRPPKKRKPKKIKRVKQYTVKQPKKRG